MSAELPDFRNRCGIIKNSARWAFSFLLQCDLRSYTSNTNRVLAFPGYSDNINTKVTHHHQTSHKNVLGAIRRWTISLIWEGRKSVLSTPARGNTGYHCECRVFGSKAEVIPAVMRAMSVTRITESFSKTAYYCDQSCQVEVRRKAHPRH